MTSIDETLDAVAGYKGVHATISLRTEDWLAFRLARDAAIKALGPATGRHQGTEMSWMTWRLDTVAIQLWTPAYRRPKPSGLEPPEDLDELLGVPNAD